MKWWALFVVAVGLSALFWLTVAFARGFEGYVVKWGGRTGGSVR
jgi:hypothetical protein